MSRKRGLEEPREKDYIFPVKEQLCVLPSKQLTTSTKESESQYEAFLAIFSMLMTGQGTVETNPKKMNAYELLCNKSNIALRPNETACNNTKSIIFKVSKQTHYKACVNGVKMDPYEYYQPKDSNGFCQMFAYFLAKEDTAEFENYLDGKRFVDVVKSVNYELNTEPFFKAIRNTWKCGQKSINLVKNDLEVMRAFETSFNTLFSDPSQIKFYGLKPGTDAKRYLSDFYSLTEADAMYFIFDQPSLLQSNKEGTLKYKLWFEGINGSPPLQSTTEGPVRVIIKRKLNSTGAKRKTLRKGHRRLRTRKSPH